MSGDARPVSSLASALLLALAVAGCAAAPAASDATSDAEPTGDPSSSDAGDTGDTGDTGDPEDTEGADSEGAEDLFPGSLRVMTFNVLCSFCSSEFDPWEERVPWIADTIARHDPDLVGLQELTFAEEVTQILDAVPGYAAIYWDPGEEPPYPDATVLYRAETFEPVERGFYWLSPTPDLPMSKGFADGFQLARLVTWVILRRLEDDAELLFATTHFDNNSPSQELSAPLVLERTLPRVLDRPGLVVGDFNSKPDSVAYGVLTGGGPPALVDAFDLAPQWTIDTNIDTNVDPLDYDTSARIDHIFMIGDGWRVSSWVVDMWTYGPEGNFVSDHFAIAAELARGPSRTR